jgi:NAD+ synthase
VADRLRIALAQLNPKVGALRDNLALAKGALADAVAAEADILLLSELFLTGYFPEDLFFKPRFVEDAMQVAGELARATKGTKVSLLLPTIWHEGRALYNAVLLAEDGKVVARRLKRELPNDDVFYEKRYFTPGPLPEPMTIKGVTIGVPICEDIWHRPVCEYLVKQGAELLPERLALLGEQAAHPQGFGARAHAGRRRAAALSQPGGRTGRTGV